MTGPQLPQSPEPGSVQDSLLGRTAAYPRTLDAGILFPIARAQSRQSLPLPSETADALPFVGEDRWTAWELSWLDPRGKPQIAVVRLTVPAESPRLVESKSLKLYLNGYAGMRFDHADAVAARIAVDLAPVLDASPEVTLVSGAAIDSVAVRALAGHSLDEQAIAIDHGGQVDPGLLAIASGAECEETLVTRLFRSNCPVTGQPDWADLQIRYRGRRIDHAGLLRYLVSFRDSREFHEHCVERIWLDIRERCRPDGLLVYARFTRRGGIDINPWRAHDRHWAPPADVRAARQ